MPFFFLPPLGVTGKKNEKKGNVRSTVSGSDFAVSCFVAAIVEVRYMVLDEKGLIVLMLLRN